MDPRSFRPHAAGRSCPLLVGRLCVAYAARPILCRTHGLPLLYRIEGQPSITFCELNFLDCPDEYFEPEQVLDMDVVNARLLEINTRFVAGELGLPVGRTDRVRLRTLLKAWERMRGASPPCRSGDRWEGL
ncbi:MAG: hypothetical protein ONB23_08945 [candidate division KSB1 bacterium]|nr:hypothetical protein [candidate division KSB1 bacterium]